MCETKDFRWFWLLLLPFGALMLLQDAYGTWYTHLAHPEHIGDTKKPIPCALVPFPLMLAPHGAWAGRCEVLCVQKSHTNLLARFFAPRGSIICGCTPQAKKIDLQGQSWSFHAHKTTFFPYHFWSSKGTLEWHTRHAGAISSTRNWFLNRPCWLAIGDHDILVNMSYHVLVQLKNWSQETQWPDCMAMCMHG